MDSLSSRTAAAIRDSTGNVIWLARPGQDRKRPPADPVAALKQSVARLALEIERSGRLRSDIATAVRTSRYTQYKSSAQSGAQAAERSLVRLQGTHLISQLQFVHAIASVRSASSAVNKQIDLLAPLTASIRQLQANVKRARQLSQDMLSQSQRRG